MEFELKTWSIEDAQSIASAANNEKIAKNLRNAFPHPYTLEDAKWYITDCIEKADKNQYTRAIAVNGKAVGSIGVFIGSDVYEKSGELGYWLAEEFWRKGIVSEAVQQICKEVFDRFDIVRIYAEPFEHNAGSRGVLEKCGFTNEGTMRKGVCKNGEIFGYCMYSLLKEDI